MASPAGQPDKPRTIRVEMVQPAARGPSPWAEPARHLRDIAKWISGGVIAAAAGVATGSSLTNLGALDPVGDRARLLLAIGGLILAVAGIGVTMRFALAVLNVDAATLDEIAEAPARTPLGRTKAAIEKHYRFDTNGFSWTEAVKHGSELGDHIEQSAAYFHVRGRFDTLLAVLPWTVLAVTAGLLTFAWAANPPDKPAAPEKGLHLRITP